MNKKISENILTSEIVLDDYVKIWKCLVSLNTFECIRCRLVVAARLLCILSFSLLVDSSLTALSILSFHLTRERNDSTDYVEKIQFKCRKCRLAKEDCYGQDCSRSVRNHIHFTFRWRWTVNYLKLNYCKLFIIAVTIPPIVNLEGGEVALVPKTLSTRRAEHRMLC